jgi:hypothetical protein
MTADYIESRHPGLGCLRYRGQLVLQRVKPAALDSCEDLNPINCVRHRHMTRITPTPSLCSYGPVEMGAASNRPGLSESSGFESGRYNPDPLVVENTLLRTPSAAHARSAQATDDN